MTDLTRTANVRGGANAVPENKPAEFDHVEPICDIRRVPLTPGLTDELWQAVEDNARPETKRKDRHGDRDQSEGTSAQVPVLRVDQVRCLRRRVQPVETREDAALLRLPRRCGNKLHKR